MHITVWILIIFDFYSISKTFTISTLVDPISTLPFFILQYSNITYFTFKVPHHLKKCNSRTAEQFLMNSIWPLLSPSWFVSTSLFQTPFQSIWIPIWVVAFIVLVYGLLHHLTLELVILFLFSYCRLSFKSEKNWKLSINYGLRTINLLTSHAIIYFLIYIFEFHRFTIYDVCLQFYAFICTILYMISFQGRRMFGFEYTHKQTQSPHKYRLSTLFAIGKLNWARYLTGRHSRTFIEVLTQVAFCPRLQYLVLISQLIPSPSHFYFTEGQLECDKRIAIAIAQFHLKFLSCLMGC